MYAILILNYNGLTVQYIVQTFIIP